MFHTLPEDSQRAIREELARPVEAPMRQASAADVNRFASSEEGAACVCKWGKDAPRKVAIVRDRIERMGCDAAWRWYYESLSTEHARVVLQVLAG
jgi:hypothetical protein